jgi:hypothetical protein
MSKEIKEMMQNAPDKCLITGMKKIKLYVFDEGVVYGWECPLNAYTFPSYDSETKEFNRVKIDMDDDFRREYETLCELWELVDHPKFNEIIEHYGISPEHIAEAKEVYREVETRRV